MKQLLLLGFLFLSFSMYAQSIVRGPYIQQINTNSVIIKWKTNQNTSSGIFYGTDSTNLDQSEISPVTTSDHELLITGLSPDTKYYYEVGNQFGSLVSHSYESTYFQTSPNAGDGSVTRFWVLGDAGTANTNQEAVRDAYYGYVQGKHTDGILMLGDNAYDSGTDAEYQAAVFDMYAEKLRSASLWSCVGNHEVGFFEGGASNSSTQSGPYYDAFTFPVNAEVGGMASGTESYYSFDYDNIHFVVLNSADEDLGTGDLMYSWAESDLSQTTKDWIVMIWHHPPYTKGSHDSDNPFPWIDGQLVDMRENYLPLVEQYGVDLVMCGHSHSYERSFLLKGHFDDSGTFNLATHALDSGSGDPLTSCAYEKTTQGANAGHGTVYVTAGSSGKTSGGDLDHPAMYTSLNELGSCVVEVRGKRMDVIFLRENGQVDDRYAIVKDDYITIECPEDTTVFISAPTTDYNYVYPAPTPFGLCASGTTVAQTDASGLTSGSNFPIGSTNQEYTATYGANQATCSWDITVVSNVGVFENLADHVKVYPTPSKGNLNIDGLSNGKQYTFYVFDLSGKKVFQIDQVFTDNFQLNLALLEKGEYILKIVDTDFKAIEKKIQILK